MMNKREIVLNLLDEGASTSYIPAGFFIHFDERYHRGQSAIDKHLEYFRYTGMDFVKIQYENRFPDRSEITKPADWAQHRQGSGRSCRQRSTGFDDFVLTIYVCWPQCWEKSVGFSSPRKP
jgi:hypothetical protein